MDIFETHKGLGNRKLHDKFLLLKNEILLGRERQVLQEWADGFEDRDNKMRIEFQTTFHSTLWELYLFQALKSLNLKVDWTKNRPDFVVTEPCEFYVEAVVSEIKKDGRAESSRNLDDIYSMVTAPWEDPDHDEIMREAITRYSNSISTKKRKYINEYSGLDWVKPDAPYVIAISSYAQVRYGKEYHYPMLALLYGMYFDSEIKTYRERGEIVKPGTDSSIPIRIFDDEDMRCVSAVVFSCTVTLGKLTSLAISKNDIAHPTNSVFLVREDNEHPKFKIQIVSADSPEDHFDGLFVFHNPNATNPLPLSLFEGTSAIQVTHDGRGVAFQGGNLPLVARLNISKLVAPEAVMQLLMKEAFESFNR